MNPSCLFSSTIRLYRGALALLALLAGLHAGAETLNWEQAVSLTARDNAELAAAQQSLVSAQAERDAAISGFLPSIKGTLSYDQIERRGATAVGDLQSSTGASTGWSAGLTGSYNLFSGFADQAKLAQAEAQRETSAAQLAAIRAKISSDLKSAFATAISSRDQVQLSAQILARRTENWRLVQLRYESGRENKGSVLLSEAYLEQARAENLQAQNGVRAAKTDLAKILGRDDEAENLELAGDVPLVEPPEIRPAIQTLAAQTPEALQAKSQARALEEAHRAARASFFPTLDLTSSLTRRGDDFFPNGSENTSIGLTLSLPFFNGGRDLNTDRAAAATARAAALTRENTVRDLRRKLEESWAAYTESALKLKADESFLRAATVRAEIARTKYNNGLSSFEDWDLIENDLIARQKAALQSKLARVKAEAQWEQSLGKGVWP